MSLPPRLLILGPVIALATMLASCTESSEVPDSFPADSAERSVVDYLLDDWSEQFRVTSVDLAMSAVGLDPKDSETRFRVANYIRNHPEIHSVIRTWGWETLALSADEKLLARAVINARRDGSPVPSVAELARAVTIPETEVETGIDMLLRHGIFLAEDLDDTSTLVPEDRYVEWAPRLDFIFHTVTLDSGRVFNTY